LYKLISLVFVCAFLCVISLPASAFTPDDGELSMLMKRNYGGLASWEAVVTFPAQPGVSAHIWYARGKWRQEWTAGDTAKAVGMNDKVGASCVEGGFALSPLFVWMPADPVATWKSWGVDNATRSYGFCGDSPCFMVGADLGDETSPVVHLDNEDMAPLLLRYRTGQGKIAVRFGDYRTVGGFRMPQHLVIEAEEQTLEAEVKWVAINRADSEELYARESLDRTPCAVPPTPFDVLRDVFAYPSVK
jgi:hypothetical protein